MYDLRMITPPVVVKVSDPTHFGSATAYTVSSGSKMVDPLGPVVSAFSSVTFLAVVSTKAVAPESVVS